MIDKRTLRNKLKCESIFTIELAGDTIHHMGSVVFSLMECGKKKLASTQNILSFIYSFLRYPQYITKQCPMQTLQSYPLIS